MSKNSPALKIGITGTDNVERFQSLLNDRIFSSVKICQSFTLSSTSVIKETALEQYNFIFYVTLFSKIANIVDAIKPLSAGLADPRNHIFIIVDNCKNLVVDDDGDLVFANSSDNTIFQKVEDSLTKMLGGENLFDLCKIDTVGAQIWNKITEDSSIVNLTEEQINILTTSLLKNANTKLSLVDKKREIKTLLKKVSLDEKLAETGYTDLANGITRHFKLLNQKKIVCQNYLFAFNRLKISLQKEHMLEINNFLKEVYGISYLKSEMHDDLTDKIDAVLFSKIKEFYDTCKNKVVIDSTSAADAADAAQTAIDAYAYHNFLLDIMEIAKGYNLSNIMEITKQEISSINNLIIEYHKKEMEKVTDLVKISSLLEIFAAAADNKDKNNLLLLGLFEKVKSNPKILHENMDKMDKWVVFVDKCLKIGVPRESIVHLIEDIILAKIAIYTDMSKANSKEISTIYPQCLHVFLLTNLNRSFIFKKLYMFISYSIRYSGRNITEFIKNLTPEQYQNLLVLENKFLELCTPSSDEQSQPMILSEVDILETFNENTSNKILGRKILSDDKSDPFDEPLNISKSSEDGLMEKRSIMPPAKKITAAVKKPIDK